MLVDTESRAFVLLARSDAAEACLPQAGISLPLVGVVSVRSSYVLSPSVGSANLDCGSLLPL